MNKTSLVHFRPFLETCTKTDVISFSRSFFLELGGLELRLGLRLELELAEIRLYLFSGVAKICQWGWFWRGMRAQPSVAGGHWRSESQVPSNGRFLQFFNKNNAFLCIFLPKYSYFELTHQLKAFKISLNVLNISPPSCNATDLILHIDHIELWIETLRW